LTPSRCEVTAYESSPFRTPPLPVLPANPGGGRGQSRKVPHVAYVQTRAHFHSSLSFTFTMGMLHTKENGEGQ
jgi:hypothetical protein